MIKQNKAPFPEKDTDLGNTKTKEMEIDTEDHPPIKLKPYQTSFPV